MRNGRNLREQTRFEAYLRLRNLWEKRSSKSYLFRNIVMFQCPSLLSRARHFSTEL
jgi:hypothetical protein